MLAVGTFFLAGVVGATVGAVKSSEAGDRAGFIIGGVGLAALAGYCLGEGFYRIFGSEETITTYRAP